VGELLWLSVVGDQWFDSLPLNKGATLITFSWLESPIGPRTPRFLGFVTRPIRRTTVGRTPVYESLALRRDLYLTRYNTHKAQTTTLPAEFEPTIPASERPQTYALDREVTVIDPF
jgi:hypothetical protein